MAPPGCGWGSATAPFGSATTTVSASNGREPCLSEPRRVRLRWPSCRTGVRADRAGVARGVGDPARRGDGRRRMVDRDVPLRRRSRSSTARRGRRSRSRQPRTVYTIVYVCTPVIVTSGIADLDPRDASRLVRDRRSAADAPPVAATDSTCSGIDAVVPVVVRLSRGHVAEDPVMLRRTEVVLDDLGDPDRVVRRGSRSSRRTSGSPRSLCASAGDASAHTPARRRTRRSAMASRFTDAPRRRTRWP